MGFLSDHYGALNTIDQLSDHNIGIGKTYNLLFYYSGNNLYCLNPDLSSKWTYSTNGKPIHDYVIDQASGLIFIGTNGNIDCISLVTGNQIWRIQRRDNWDNGKVTCSHKNGLIYDYVHFPLYSEGYVNVYDYNGQHKQRLSKELAKFVYSDLDDALVYLNSDILYSVDKNFTLITRTSGFVARNFVLEKKLNKLFLLTDRGLRTSTPRTVNSSTSLNQQSYGRYDDLTNSTDTEGFIYISRVGTSLNYLIKLDKRTGEQVYNKQIRMLQSESYRSTVTQDADYIYQYVSSEQSDGRMYKIRKSDGEIVVRHALGVGETKLLHTYDSLT